MIKKLTYSENEIDEIAKNSIAAVSTPSIFCFYGGMGVGKTTFIKALIKQLGAVDTGHSPTFGLVNEYADASGAIIAYHFDFYRLNHEYEALDLGVEDYLHSGKWVFVEWPEKIASILPKDTLKLKLKMVDKTHRSLEVVCF